MSGAVRSALAAFGSYVPSSEAIKPITRGAVALLTSKVALIIFAVAVIITGFFYIAKLSNEIKELRESRQEFREEFRQGMNNSRAHSGTVQERGGADLASGAPSQQMIDAIRQQLSQQMVQNVSATIRQEFDQKLAGIREGLKAQLQAQVQAQAHEKPPAQDMTKPRRDIEELRTSLSTQLESQMASNQELTNALSGRVERLEEAAHSDKPAESNPNIDLLKGSIRTLNQEFSQLQQQVQEQLQQLQAQLQAQADAPQQVQNTLSESFAGSLENQATEFASQLAEIGRKIEALESAQRSQSEQIGDLLARDESSDHFESPRLSRPQSTGATGSQASLFSQESGASSQGDGENAQGTEPGRKTKRRSFGPFKLGKKPPK